MYATKPVFSLFTAGSKRAGMQAEGKGGGVLREGGYEERERNKHQKQQQQLMCVLNDSKHFGRNKWLMD